MTSLLITGTAGFIGFHLARRLLDEGHAVFGLDNFNDDYSVQLKRARHPPATPATSLHPIC